MFDDLKDKFSSDDEYEEFKNSYNDYKNKTGMFSYKDNIEKIIEFQQLLYDNFIIDKKKFMRIPEKYLKTANLPLYIFYCEKVLDIYLFTLNMN